MGGSSIPQPKKPVDRLTLPQNMGKSNHELIKDARENFGMDVTQYFNFAVVGQSGVGKSSLINGLRGLRDDDPEAALVRETETTTIIRKYPHPAHSHVVFWDLPGAGTPRNPSSTYFSDYMLYSFDCIVIVSSDRFLQIDFDVARMASQFKRPVVFLRTKADLAMRSVAERDGKQMIDASRILRINVDDSFRKGMDEAKFARGTYFSLFIVSAPRFTPKPAAYSRYDYETGNLDVSLKIMDENKFLLFLVDCATVSKCKMQNANSPPNNKL